MSELRWNALLGEWVIVATHRQDRTYKPAADFCPLCPSMPGRPQTEIPASEYDIVVFENRFPSLHEDPLAPTVTGTPIGPVRPARGVCEVVVYSSRHDGSLASESERQIAKLVRVWTERFADLRTRDSIEYVFIFENRGEEVGVTLHHPHGQIYAYPFLPPRIAREIEMARLHTTGRDRCLWCDMLSAERSDGRRIIAETASFTAFVPFSARWPYEVHIVASRHIPDLIDLRNREVWHLASILKTVLTAYDALFDRPLPYVMALHQAPVGGSATTAFHFHIELYPVNRSRDRLKFPAGSERGAGVFINDTLPEDKAAELRAHVERLVAPTPGKSADPGDPAR